MKITDYESDLQYQADHLERCLWDSAQARARNRRMLQAGRDLDRLNEELGPDDPPGARALDIHTPGHPAALMVQEGAVDPSGRP